MVAPIPTASEAFDEVTTSAGYYRWVDITFEWAKSLDNEYEVSTSESPVTDSSAVPLLRSFITTLSASPTILSRHLAHLSSSSPVSLAHTGHPP